jgi:hypothetical protein
MNGWLTIGKYQYEYNMDGILTGWYRCVGGKLDNGRWPAWNDEIGRMRYC